MFYYKYLPPERIDVLRDLSIRFTQPLAQNDLFEFRTVSSLFLSNADYLRTLASDLPAFFDTFGESNYLVDYLKSDLRRDRGEGEWGLGLASRVQMIIEELGGKLGILSLTDDPTNPVMWAHYAASHAGFLIAFAPDHPWFRQNRIPADDFQHTRTEDLRHIRKVGYIEVGNTTPPDLRGRDIFYTKSKKWEYESEWRMIWPLRERQKELRRDIFLFRVPPSSIGSVILGLRSSSQLETGIRKIIGGNERLSHVYIGRAKEDWSSAGISIPGDRKLGL